MKGAARGLIRSGGGRTDGHARITFSPCSDEALLARPPLHYATTAALAARPEVPFKCVFDALLTRHTLRRSGLLEGALLAEVPGIGFVSKI